MNTIFAIVARHHIPTRFQTRAEVARNLGVNFLLYSLR